MGFEFGGSEINQKTVIGHPSGLFVLFFTEMWERFSYFGMRALLVLFLVSDISKNGWGWPRQEALALYALYTGLVYLTPIIGGIIADHLIGYRKAIVIGALLMTLGHLCLAMGTHFFFYAGLVFLILGNGTFKPNISSIVGNMYKNNPEKKDSAFTIFYMGVNAGAFLGILMCGYIGENVSWSYGFGLAGIFMFFGLLQFWFGQGIFGDIGLSPLKIKEKLQEKSKVEEISPILSEQPSKKVIKDRLLVIGIFAFFTIFFWMAFEQAGGSMTIFAKDYTHRLLTGNTAMIFKWINTALTVFPLIVVTLVVVLLAKQIFLKYTLSIIFISLSFLIIWVIAIWMLIRTFETQNTNVPASWFGILNSFFIIALAPLFSKLWESKYNPSGPIKFALGLALLGLGFAILAYGAGGIAPGAKTASVSMIWLILAYLFHTIGELCLSPVGLSYVSKLSPIKLVGMMFGVWFIANFIANTLAGLTGGLIDKISKAYSMSGFFLIFTILPILAALALVLMNRWLIKKMHGVA